MTKLAQPTTPEYRRLRNILYLVAVLAVITPVMLFIGNRNDRAWDNYNTCLRGNNLRVIIKDTFNGMGRSIDKSFHTHIQSTVVQPNVDQITLKVCGKKPGWLN